MRKSWLVCVLMGALGVGALAWAQAAPAAADKDKDKESAMEKDKDNDKDKEKDKDEAKEAAKPKPPEEVAEDAVVLTIKGVCPPTAAAKTATGATGTKTAAAKKPADCETKMTRREFEKIASGLSPNVTPQLKRQLATALPKFMAMSEAAKKQGLENSEQYKETLKVAKMQILTTQLQRKVQEDADKIPDSEIEAYYKKNPEAYEQFSLDRLFIPKNKQMEPEKDNEDEDKMTDEQKKAKADAEKAKQEAGQKELDALAETLQKRAAAGEDFAKLQKEAYDAAGMKMDNPTVNLPTVRRTGLPPAHKDVFDLKVGEVSPVISDNGGHYIYKVVSKTELPLDDKIKAEIHNTLKSQKLKEEMDKYQNSYSVTQNEAYFGPPQGPGGRPGMPPGMRMAPPPMRNAPAPGAPAQQAPPASPK
jgi:hypothetical protein